MEFLIISGMSGAGKSRTADVLEDLDFYCVDNMPTALLPKFAEFCLGMHGRYERVAIVTDIRDRDGFTTIFDSLDKLRELGCDYKILFVEASLESVVKRYKESRRPHPLQSRAQSLEAAVLMEKNQLSQLRDRANYVIDTTNLTLGMLQSIIYNLFIGSSDTRKLTVNIMSFGFKYGIPVEADMVFDVRFLPNPYYVTELRKLTGNDAAVADFVFSHDTSRDFMAKLEDLVAFLLPQYVEEGKYTLTIAVGCTGGQHRSVAVAKRLSGFIRELGHNAELRHRDIEK